MKKNGKFSFIFKKRYPDQEDELYICHQRQTDSPLGDLFGAKIETWNCDKYYRHCFTGVKKNTPAAAMKLQCVNNKFYKIRYIY